MTFSTFFLPRAASTITLLSALAVGSSQARNTAN
jgi:hypothetical protein